jgi:hypothetical protein
VTRLTAFTLIAVSLLNVACGNGTSQPPERPRVEAKLDATSPDLRVPAGTRPQDVLPDHSTKEIARPQSDEPVGPRGPGSRRIVIPGGVVVTTPPSPTSTETPAPASCGRQRVLVAGGEKKVTTPPRPGIQALRVNPQTVLVRWRFSALPGACRPARLRLTVDVSDDILPGKQTVFKISNAHGEKALPVPADLAAADVLHASALDTKGRQSPTASVAIR